MQALEADFIEGVTMNSDQKGNPEVELVLPLVEDARDLVGWTVDRVKGLKSMPNELKKDVLRLFAEQENILRAIGFRLYGWGYDNDLAGRIRKLLVWNGGGKS